MGRQSTISAGVPVELAAELAAFLTRSGRSTNEVVEAALRDYLDEIAFEASLDEAERDIDEGRFHTQEQMDVRFAEVRAAANRRIAERDGTS